MNTENKPAEQPKGDKQKKTATREYLVQKKFTGEKVHYPSHTVTLDADSDQTKYLLTNKFIK